MDPRETEELLDGLFGSESLWRDSDEDIETTLDGVYWDQHNLQDTGRTLRRKRRERQKAASPSKDAIGKSGAVTLPISFKQSWNRTVASCKASGIDVPFFLRVYHRRYLELPADRKNSTKRRLDWFHLEAFDRLQDPFHQDNVRGWPPAKVQAWRNREIDPAGYYLHFRDPGEKLQPHGAWTASEHTAFVARLDTFKVNDWMPDASWGLFSRALVGRTGLECREYYHTLLQNGVLFDPAYGPDSTGKLHRISELPSSALGCLPRSENRLSDAWRTADVQRVAGKVDTLITKIHPTVQQVASRAMRKLENEAKQKPSLVKNSEVAKRKAESDAEDTPSPLQSQSPELEMFDVVSTPAPPPPMKKPSPPKKPEISAEEVHDLVQDIKDLDGRKWQIKPRLAADGTELRGRQIRSDIRDRLARYREARETGVRLSMPKLVEDDDDEEEEKEGEEEDVMVEHRDKSRMTDDVSTSGRPPWARSKRSWNEESSREKKSQRKGGSGSGGADSGPSRRWPRSDDISDDGGDREARKRKSKSLGAGGMRRPSPPPRVKPPQPASQDWRIEGESISDYEDEEAEGWQNPLLFPESEQHSAVHSVRTAELLPSLGSVPTLQASVGLAADSRFEGFPRPIPLDPAQWKFLPYTLSYSTSLFSLPPTEENIAVVVASLLDADRDPSPALSTIYKFVSGDFLMAPAEHLKIQRRLLVETERLVSQLPQLWRVDLAAGALFSQSYKRGAEIRLYALQWMERIGRDKTEKYNLENYIDNLIDEFFCLFGARPHAASLGASVPHPLFALWTEMVNTAERAELLWWYLLGQAWQRHDKVVPGTAQTKPEEIDEFRWHTLFLSAGALGPAASGWAQVSLLLRPFSSSFVLSSGLAQSYSLSSIAAYLVTPVTSPHLLLCVYRRTLLLRLLALARYWHVECGLDGEVTLNLARFFALPSSVHSADARLPLQLLYGLPDSAHSPAPRDNAHELYLRFLALQVAKAPAGKVPKMWREIMLRKTLPPNPVTVVPDSNWPPNEGTFTLATASAFLAQLVVIAPTLHEADLKFLPARLAGLFAAPFAEEEDTRATLVEVHALLAAVAQARNINLAEKLNANQPSLLEALCKHIRELKDRTRAPVLYALQRCVEALLSCVLLRRQGRLVATDYALLDAVVPLLDLHSTPIPPPATFNKSSLSNISKSSSSTSSPPAAHSSIAYAVQALAVRCVSAALEPARVESGRAAQIATAQKLRDPLFTALATCAISLSPESENVMPALIDALARALANQLQYGQPKLSPAAMVTELERRFLSVPSTRARALPAAILCAVARETRDKINLILDLNRHAIGRIWLSSLFDPAAYARAQPQSVPYRFTALILRSPNPGHLVEFPNAAEVAGGLPARPLAYDTTLQLIISWADGIAARIAKIPALVMELREFIFPFVEWLLSTIDALRDGPSLRDYFQFAMRAVAELLTRIPSVIYAPPPARTIGPKLLDRFVSFPGRGAGSEHVLLTYLDSFISGLSRLPFSADPYLDRVFTIGVYSRCLSLSSGSNLPPEALAVRQNPKETAQKMRILARAAWITPARGGEEVRKWLSRATGQLLGTAAPPLAYHLLTFASALLEERRSRLSATRFKECLSHADSLAPGIGDALSRAQFTTESGLQLRRAIYDSQTRVLNRAAQFAPDIDFTPNAAFLLLLRFTLLDALHTVALLLGLEQFAPAVNTSISLLNGRTSALSSLAARAPAPLRSLSQHKVGAALSLFQPDPPGVTIARLQEATLRDALSLCAAAAATPQARGVAFAALTDLFELCTLLRFLALPAPLARFLIAEEQVLVGLLGGGQVFWRQSHDVLNVVDTEL